ncbi:hypothetical protein ACPOLB_00500 [Rubrivivax sp. RP6-9]|uniref:hypothetical protein n=1 Tax=Rubrivivax sp. RP6-9 TaxID=3415750 RepID=UPI003CC657AA
MNRLAPAGAGRVTGFFARRWRGEVPMRTVLWSDMLARGTAVNILATFVAMLAASQGSPTWAAAAIHFSPLPYNLFLFAAVGRASPRSRVATVLATVWLCAMTIV